MSIEIIPLGTSSAIPTRERHFSALALRREGRVLLFDCGEGTQFQLVRAGLKAPRIDAVFITHLHGDHVYGLPGLLASLGLLGREAPLDVVGPRGIGEMLDHTPSLSREWLPFALRLRELEEDFSGGCVFRGDGYRVVARPIAHSCFCIGYRFEEDPSPGHLDAEAARRLGVMSHEAFRALKRGEAVQAADGRHVGPDEVVGPEQPGVVFAYVSDTRPCDGGRVLAQHADLLYHEATFEERHAERAAETGHSTARQAAGVARDAGARRLLLGHFSARYREPDVLEREAQALFPGAQAAVECERYRVEPAPVADA